MYGCTYAVSMMLQLLVLYSICHPLIPPYLPTCTNTSDREYLSLRMNLRGFRMKPTSRSSIIRSTYIINVIIRSTYIITRLSIIRSIKIIINRSTITIMSSIIIIRSISIINRFTSIINRSISINIIRSSIIINSYIIDGINQSVSGSSHPLLESLR